jgi:hypothetical protein
LFSVVGAVGVGAGSSPKFRSSPIGPLVALMPGAVLVAGTAGASGAAAGIGASVAWGSTALGTIGASVVVAGVAEAAVGGGGATAPAGSGAEKKIVSLCYFRGESSVIASTSGDRNREM